MHCSIFGILINVSKILLAKLYNGMVSVYAVSGVHRFIIRVGKNTYKSEYPHWILDRTGYGAGRWSNFGSNPKAAV